jgi:hypothetical protein
VFDVDDDDEDPLIIPDDNGGAYIIWRDYRYENYYGDIYAQHIDSNGEQLWASGGIPLSNHTGGQSSHNLCIDGNGGAFAVWADKYGSGTYRGTHLSSDGPLTTEEGTLISNHQSGGFSLEYAGNSSAVMVWGQGVTLDTYECTYQDPDTGELITDEIFFNLDDCNQNCEDGDDNDDNPDCAYHSFETGDIRAQRFNAEMEILWNEDESNSGKIICDDEYLQSKAKLLQHYPQM